MINPYDQSDALTVPSAKSSCLHRTKSGGGSEMRPLPVPFRTGGEATNTVSKSGIVQEV